GPNRTRVVPPLRKIAATARMEVHFAHPIAERDFDEPHLTEVGPQIILETCNSAWIRFEAVYVGPRHHAQKRQSVATIVTAYFQNGWVRLINKRRDRVVGKWNHR